MILHVGLFPSFWLLLENNMFFFLRSSPAEDLASEHAGTKVGRRRPTPHQRGGKEVSDTPDVSDAGSFFMESFWNGMWVCG